MRPQISTRNEIESSTCSFGLARARNDSNTAFPCRHGAHCLLHMRKNLRSYVDEEYRVTSYVSTYSGDILPIPPKEDWPPFTGPLILPTIQRKKAGRPSIYRKEKERRQRSSMQAM